MQKDNVLKISKLSVAALIGVTFLLSAVMKLITIDSFEVYIYSFNVFSFVTTTILSRLLIATEFFIGFCLVFRLFYKKTWWISLLMLAFFSAFLAYVIMFRNDDNCHCFGSLIDMDPKQSLVKNIVMIALLIFVKKVDDFAYKARFKKWLWGIILCISIIVPFVVVPNDLIYNKIYSEKENINTIAFGESLNDSTYIGYLKVVPEKINDTLVYENAAVLMDVSDGRYLINYVIAGCQYCKMGAERLTIMFDKHGIAHEKLKFVIGGNPIPMSLFIRKTKTYDYEHWKISQPKMMSITYGQFPLYVFVEDGKIVKAVDFRHLDEAETVEFLNGR